MWFFLLYDNSEASAFLGLILVGHLVFFKCFFVLIFEVFHLEDVSNNGEDDHTGNVAKDGSVVGDLSLGGTVNEVCLVWISSNV